MAHRRVFTAPTVESDVKNAVVKATVLPILTYGVSNFNLSDHDERALEAKWDFLNNKLHVHMGGLQVGREARGGPKYLGNLFGVSVDQI